MPCAPRSRATVGSLLLLWLACGVAQLGGPPARADGMFAPKVGEGVANTSNQEAILLFGDGWTRLILRTGYHGDGTEFYWVIPTWGLLQPGDVTALERDLLATLDTFSAPQLVTYELACGTSLGCGAEGSTTENDTATEQGAVTVIESFHVGGYEINVLEASGAGFLGQWLRDRGFAVPKDGDQVFDQYITRHFNFVTVHFASPSADSRPGQGEGEGEGGSGGADAGQGGSGDPQGPTTSPAPALVLRFPVVMNTFPLQISSLSSNRPTEILLFTLGTGRYRPAPADFPAFDVTLTASYQGDDFTGYYHDQLLTRLSAAGGKAFAVEYAGPLSARLQRNFGLIDDAAHPDLRDGERGELFLTRLHARLEPAQMDRDVVLEPVLGEGWQAQHRVRVVRGYEPQPNELATVLPFDLLLILGLAQLARLRQRRRSRP